MMGGGTMGGGGTVSGGMMGRRPTAALAALGALTALATATLAVPAAPAAARPAGTATPIRHFVYLMQGDRTFDNYFGTFPGADGIPAGACQPLVLSRPRSGCVKPYALHGTTPQPLEPGRSTIAAQMNGGKLDGFVAAYAAQGRDGTAAMGHYDERDLPLYWNVARRYVLFDRFFASVPYGYRTNRSFWVSAAPQPGGAQAKPGFGGAEHPPTQPGGTDKVPAGGYGNQPTIFDRLQAAGVSWKFYVQDYQPKQTFRSLSATDPAAQTVRVPLLNYARFVDDPVLNGHIVDLDQYYRDLSAGTLPAVAYVATSGASERSARSIHSGQELIRSMLTQLMLSPYWPSSAFLWSYDGSGGWYDHVAPPAGYGLRVPALLVSPYARRGRVDHTPLDSVAALRFIERNWSVPALGARDARSPEKSGRLTGPPKPQATPAPDAGDLTTAFDFAAAPRPADILPVDPAGAVHPPLVRVSLIYWYYGGALLLLCAFLTAAAVPRWRVPARRRRRPGAGQRPNMEVPVR